MRPSSRCSSSFISVPKLSSNMATLDPVPFLIYGIFHLLFQGEKKKKFIWTEISYCIKEIKRKMHLVEYSVIPYPQSLTPSSFCFHANWPFMTSNNTRATWSTRLCVTPNYPARFVHNSHNWVPRTRFDESFILSAVFQAEFEEGNRMYCIPMTGIFL